MRLKCSSILSIILASIDLLSLTDALTLDVDSTGSIKQAASAVAYTMLTGYTGNHTGDVPGNLPAPYFWWECGGMMGNLIDYWFYTGDTTYNELVTQALLWQAGVPATFMPANQSKNEGNDDQSFWGFAAMTAAETNFPNPPSDQPQWLEMAQGVFNQQANRWDTTSCGGGLKWQIFTFNNGYDYKNSISNGAFFAMGARLAAYTGNATYAQWAERTWNWISDIGLMDSQFNIFDGSNDLLNCTDWDRTQWSYNAGVFLLGAANMYKYTNGSALWLDRTEQILNRTVNIFFSKQIMYEQACENFAGQTNFCNNDQLSFKAHLSRWMAITTQLVPSTAATIMPLLKASAVAAAAQCSAGTSGNQCGARWTSTVNDGSAFNIGQQMSALSVVGSLLQPQTQALFTNTTGGTSVGNNDAGSTVTNTLYTAPVATTRDRAGAGVLTTFLLAGFVGTTYFMVKE